MYNEINNKYEHTYGMPEIYSTNIRVDDPMTAKILTNVPKIQVAEPPQSEVKLTRSYQMMKRLKFHVLNF